MNSSYKCILIGIFTIIFSCKSQNKNGILDLSNKGLDSIPNLSKKNEVINLDLSGNNISFWDEKKIPPNVNKLNLSHNKITKEVKISPKKLNFLKYIDLSHNDIEKFYSYSYSLDTIKINNNNIKQLLIFNSKQAASEKKINYLDISENKYLSNALDFPPSNIKSIKYNGILNDGELYFKLVRKKK